MRCCCVHVLIRWQEVVDGVERSVSERLRAEALAPANKHGLLDMVRSKAQIEPLVLLESVFLQVAGCNQVGGADIDILGR